VRAKTLQADPARGRPTMVQKQTPALPPRSPCAVLPLGHGVARMSTAAAGACRTAASRVGVGCWSALQPSSTAGAVACSRAAAASLDAVLVSRAPVQSSAWAGTSPRPPFGSRRLGRFRAESMLAVPLG
jgi:hypothetical protein